MRRLVTCLLGGTAFLSIGPVYAADALKFGPPPTWVHPQAIPPAKPSDAPVSLLLNDEQIAFEHGKVTTYSDAAIKIQTAQGLSAAGNLAVVWQPSTDTMTVNKLLIHRGDKIIDVLASGQSFTTLRRETNLDAATLDGTLTATIQPEGLQQGDVLELATTLEHSDPVLKGHVESMFGTWDGLRIQSAHARLIWPTDLHVSARETPNLPAAQKSSAGGMNVLEISAQNVDPLVPPKGAPERFLIGRLAEASDYSSWSDLADLMIPLFRDASVIPPSGPLHDEVEKIRVSTPDSKSRATQALALVQDRIRYVALLMGQGGYVPASAEQTWSRRFGDCKGKTALLLGILHSLGIQAEPVLAQAQLGDMVADRLPMIALFNHVLVRAHIGGKDYWLDGTRTGDTDLDLIEIPDFGWGLPLVAHAQLVHMVPAPLDRPNLEHRVNIDASAGVFADAPIVIDEIYRGDTAVALNTVYSTATATQRDEALRQKAESYFDDFNVKSSSVQFDKARQELDLKIEGSAKLSWKDGWFYVPTSSVGFDPDFDRTAGPLHNVPLAVDHPRYVKDEATVRLPHGFAAQQKLSAPVHETLAGVQYERSEIINGDVLAVDSSERSLAPEVPYADALTAEPKLRALNNDDVYLSLAERYLPTAKDASALKEGTPRSATDFFIRAEAEGANNQANEAMADLKAGLLLDPKNSWALKKRAWINIHRQHFEEAEADLKEVAAAHPNDPDLVAYRGTLALGEGDLNAASAEFDQALERDPKNVVAHVGRASILLQQGKLDESLRELTSALTLDPKNVDALVQRAWILESRNDRAGADKDLTAALAAEPNNAAALTTKAGIAAERKDFDTAKEFAAKALAIDPNNSNARMLQSQLLKREGNDNQAMASFDAAVENAPHDVDPLLDRAHAYIEAKNFVAAENDISAALAIDVSNLRALKARAELASAKGDYAGAVAAYTAALAASPSDASILEGRAGVYRSLHKFDLALADTDAAMKAGQTSPELRLLRINILVSKGDMAAVPAEVEQLTKENPTSDFAFVAAGKTYAYLGMRDKATASFNRALEIQPQAYIYLNRAQVRPYADLQGKLADIEAALKLEPDNEDVLAEKARLLSKAGKGDEAIALYDQAMKIALDNSYLKLGRAEALQRAGRSAEARKAFDSVLSNAKTAGDFNRLCWAKATNDMLLQSALDDCRHAAQIDPNYPGLHESLGVVLLKLGKFQDALAELNKAVTTKSGAEAYMARAIVQSRLGDRAAARSDASEARRLRADIDDTFADYGLKFDNPSPTSAAAIQ